MGHVPLDLLGLGRWPSMSVRYGVTAGSPPTLDIALRFDASRYADAGSPGPIQQAALTDVQTLARAHYELAQVHPDGSPDVTIAIASSLDGGTPHVLDDTDRAIVRGLGLEAWRYLQGLVAGTAAPRTEPITVIFSVPIAATNAANIFELTVSLTVARNPLNASADQDPHGLAVAVAVPLVGDPGSTTDAATLAAFATAFEQAYTAGDTVLKVGVDATGTTKSPRLWAVRTSATSRAGAIGCEVTGPPVFWAPPPLSREPISRTDVEIWPFDLNAGLDPGAPERRNYVDVDVDAWARQALDTIETLLLPRYSVRAYVLDVGGSTSYLDRLGAAKASLAASIAETVQGVLTMPPAPTDRAAIADAQRTWRQQLLVSLSSAYAVDAAVQLPVTLSWTSDGGGAALVLRGHPIVAPPKGWSAGTSSTPPCSLSPFRIFAADGPGHLTFLVTANDPGDQAYIRLDLGYRVDHVEHQIGGVDGHKTTTWLTFPNPMPEVALSDPELATLRVPIVLRACPDPPTLAAQRSQQTLDHTNAQTLVHSATAWTYVAEHSEPRIAQDVTQATVWFNAVPRPAPPTPPKPAALETDVFTPLARLIAALPELQACFDADLVGLTPATDPSTPQFTRAGHALDAFTTLVEDVAANWAPVPPTAGPDDAVLSATERTFTVAEMRYPAPTDQNPGGGDQLLVTITPDPLTPRPPVVAMPALVFDGYQPVPTGAGVRYQDPNSQGFLSWNTARTAPARSVVTGPLEIFNVENAQFGMRLVRNAALLPGNPTRDPFVSRTPLVTFARPFTPMLSIEDPIDVAAIATGTPAARPLAEQLQAMFEAFFAAAPAGTEERMQLGVVYRRELPSAPAVVLPVALLPSTAFTVPVDWSPPSGGPDPPTDGSSFVAGLAQLIGDWVKNNQLTSDGQFSFDLTAFSVLGASTLPLARLSRMTLYLADVTDP